MKKQNNFRRFISFLLCLVMIVSVFSMFSFADVAGENTAYYYACSLCGGRVDWLPLGTENHTEIHTYIIYNSDGSTQTDSCTITTKVGGDCLVCYGCGTVLAENSYVISVTHSKCGA